MLEMFNQPKTNKRRPEVVVVEPKLSFITYLTKKDEALHVKYLITHT
jgi:hypothetical protein